MLLGLLPHRYHCVCQNREHVKISSNDFVLIFYIEQRFFSAQETHGVRAGLGRV